MLAEILQHDEIRESFSTSLELWSFKNMTTEVREEVARYCHIFYERFDFENFVWALPNLVDL